MPTLSPVDFTASLRGKDLTRGNLFEVIMNPPAAANRGATANTLKFRIKSAVIPSVEIGEAVASFNGRDIKLTGDRVYGDVTLNAYLDKETWETLTAWVELSNGSESNTALFDSLADYSTDIIVNVLNRKEEIIQEITYVDSWIKTLGEVELDWGTKDSIAELPITVTMQSFKVNGVTR